MHAEAVHLASHAVCSGLAVSVENMVSDEIEAGNEKPRTGVGAGSFIESGFFVLRASSPRTCWLGNKYEYEQRRHGGNRGRSQAGGGVVALQHEVEITICAMALSTLAGVIVRKSFASRFAAAWLRLKPKRPMESRALHCAENRGDGALFREIRFPVMGLGRFQRFVR
ncbi:hypothetical protein [Stenotrophomonas humi]